MLWKTNKEMTITDVRILVPSRVSGSWFPPGQRDRVVIREGHRDR